MAVQPKWLAKILNGEKTVEIRKTIPECLKNGEPITVWLYCTKKQHTELVFRKGEDSGYGFNYDKTIFVKMPEAYWSLPLGYHGKVVAKCVVEKYDYIENEPSYEEDYLKHNLDKTACMTSDEYYAYATWAKDGHVYALHLTALTVFDKPMELKEFTVRKEVLNNDKKRIGWLQGKVTRAPQSWMYVEVGE
jgi:hypothetical protein